MIYIIIAFAVFIILWGIETKKAAKDPDVIEASELMIPIWRYKKYKDAWDKIQEIYKEFGVDSQISNNMANEIISKLPNLNEWRRYSDKQFKKSMKSFHDFEKEYNDYMKK